MSSQLYIPARPRRTYRRTVWIGLLVMLLIVLFVGVGRVILIHRMMLPRLTLSQPGYVLSVSVTPDGKKIITGIDALDYAAQNHHRVWRGIPADVLVWDAATGYLSGRLHGLTARSNEASISPDGRRVFAVGPTASGLGKSSNYHILAWDINSSQQLWNRDSDTPLSISPDGRFVACSGTVLRADDGTEVCRIRPLPATDGQSEFTPDSHRLGLIGAGHLNPKTSFREDSDDGRSYYATTRLRFWDADTGKLISDLPFTRVRTFDFTRNGRELIMTSDIGATVDGFDAGGIEGSIIRRVEFLTGKVLWEQKRNLTSDPDAILNSVAISPNGKYVVVQSSNSRLIVLDARTGRELFRPFIHHGPRDPNWALPGGVAFSADGRSLVSRCGSRVLVWDTSILQ